MAKKFNLSQLGELKEYYQEKAQIQDTSASEVLPSIPDPYGTVIEQDAGDTKTTVFITRFSPNDINDFIQLLGKNSPLQHRHDLEIVLSEYLSNWRYDHPDQCPYEPFLWALKFTDNYIGSLQNNANPQPWILQAVGKTLANVWDEQNQLFIQVLQNVLNRWDWYQPVHAMLYLYQTLTSVNDEQIDQYIRNEWLYRALYSTTAFNCLLEKKKSKENIQALMRFVSQDIQKDLNMTPIPITKKMRTAMNDYIENASDEEFALAETFYRDSLYNCSKKARQSFDEVFSKNEAANSIYKIISDWKNAQTETDVRILKKQLRNLFEKDSKKAAEVISAAAASDCNQLVAEVLNLVKQQDIGFNTQFLVKAIAESAGVCNAYSEFVTRKFKEHHETVFDDESFIYGCAYCHMGHPEILGDLFNAYFLDSIGLKNAKYLFSILQYRYLKQFTEQVEKITNRCLSDENMALALIQSCSQIYSSKNANFYPSPFDQVCELLVTKVLEEGSSAARYASALMDLYEQIVDVKNRDRYHDALQKIALDTHSFPLDMPRKRAKNLIRSIYSAL